MSKILVIGGGPAGMMAAYAAAMDGHEVLLLEKNEKLGKKLYITGKGRCNVTNAAGMDEQLKNVVRNPKFLYSAFRGFTNEDLMALIEAEGCPLKTERGQRVFPVSDHSSDIIKAMERALRESGVRVRLRAEVQDLLIRDGACRGLRLRNGEDIPADAVIAATGGISYPSTGSTGDGYKWAREAGHSVTRLYPSLVSLTVKEGSCAKLQGLSLKNVNLSVYAGDKKLFTEFGEMLFTRFGVSGPLVLSASAYVTERLPGEELRLEIDLKPALSAEKLDLRLLRDLEKYRNKELKNALADLLPARLIQEVIAQSGLDPDKKANELTKAERQALGHTLKALRFTAAGTGGFREAVVTRGGISVADINPKTMESKLIQNLHFAGEVLDVDALTGGFNLQIAWSTGWAAGKGVGHEH